MPVGALGVRAVIKFSFDSENEICAGSYGSCFPRGAKKGVTDAQYKVGIITLNGFKILEI